MAYKSTRTAQALSSFLKSFLLQMVMLRSSTPAETVGIFAGPVPGIPARLKPSAQAITDNGTLIMGGCGTANATTTGSGNQSITAAISGSGSVVQSGDRHPDAEQHQGAAQQ